MSDDLMYPVDAVRAAYARGFKDGLEAAAKKVGAASWMIPWQQVRLSDDIRALSPAPAGETYWEQEAKRYAGNADYWRERAEVLEANHHTDMATMGKMRCEIVGLERALADAASFAANLVSPAPAGEPLTGLGVLRGEIYQPAPAAPVAPGRCARCDGTGSIQIPCPDGRRGCAVFHSKPCTHCGGTGADGR